MVYKKKQRALNCDQIKSCNHKASKASYSSYFCHHSSQRELNFFGKKVKRETKEHKKVTKRRHLGAPAGSQWAPAEI